MSTMVGYFREMIIFNNQTALISEYLEITRTWHEYGFPYVTLFNRRLNGHADFSIHQIIVHNTDNYLVLGLPPNIAGDMPEPLYYLVRMDSRNVAVVPLESTVLEIVNHLTTIEENSCDLDQLKEIVGSIPTWEEIKDSGMQSKT